MGQNQKGDNDRMGALDEIPLQPLVHWLDCLPVPMCYVLRYSLAILPSTVNFLDRVVSLRFVLLQIRTLLQSQQVVVQVWFAEGFMIVYTDGYAKCLQPGESLSIMVV
jgi:hypothetical protein